MKVACYAVAVAVVLITLPLSSVGADYDYTIHLKSHPLTPVPMKDPSGLRAAQAEQHSMIQFNRPLNENDKDRLDAAGIELLNYIPGMTFVARINKAVDKNMMAQFDIRWIGPIEPNDKLQPQIAQHGISSWARRDSDRVQFVVVLHPDEDLQKWADEFQTQFNAEIIGTAPIINGIDLIMPEQAMYPMLDLDAVAWLEQAPPPPVEDNNSCRENNGSEVLQAGPYYLTGSGVRVAEWDGGLADDNHTDLIGRVFHADNTSIATHATHVAGTVIGDGTASGGLYRGMAPSATLVSYLWWGSVSEMNNEYTNAIEGWNCKLATNSWGYGVGDPATESSCQQVLGNYFTENTAIDNIVRGNFASPISICWSAGNQRGSSSSYCGSIGWTYGTIGALSTAKNIICVGAINSNNSSMTNFSSWGPTDDGRIKPDVVGPGCQSSSDYGVTSTKPGSGYTVMCGTSMSTPATAGALALLYQQYYNTIFGTPLPSTVKAIVINTAEDLGATGPDYQYGHGKVDAVAAAEKIAMGEPSYLTNSISTGVVHTYDLTVPSGGAANLKVTLCWDDVGGTTSASMNLINDLDLVLVDPFTNIEYPWVLNPAIPALAASRDVDHLNNVETVEIPNPTPGLWKARVTGYNIPQGPQTYSLVFTPDSIYTPGNLAALAVFDAGDVSQDPGQTAMAEFWVTNVGAARDSLQVTISDNNLWMASTIDSVVALDPWDSAYFQVSADVPGGAIAGDDDSVVCNAASLLNAGVEVSSSLTLTANAYYGIALSGPVDDTVNSPAAYVISATLTSSGNSYDQTSLLVSNDLGWNSSPSYQQITLPPFGDSTVSVTIFVPAEIADQTINSVKLTLFSSGGPGDSTTFELLIDNPYLPPALASPANSSYINDRTPEFIWSGGGDSFSLYIALDTGFTQIVHSYGGITGSSYIIPDADSLGDGKYYWGTRLYVGVDSSSLQANPFFFIVDNTAPYSMHPISPLAGAYVNVTNFLLIYGQGRETTAAGSAPEYNVVELSQDSNFAGGISRYEPLMSNSYLVHDTLPQGRWYWRVQRADSAGNASPFSTAATFILDTQTPAVPVLLAPTNESNVQGDITIKWTSGGTPPAWEHAGEYYHVQAYDAGFQVFYEANEYADSVVFPEATFTNGELYYWRVRSLDSANHASSYATAFKFTYLIFQCGDVDGALDGVTISDLTFLVEYLFNSGPEPTPLQAGSMNCDEAVDVSDLTALVEYLFDNGAAPCCP